MLRAMIGRLSGHLPRLRSSSFAWTNASGPLQAIPALNSASINNAGLSRSAAHTSGTRAVGARVGGSDTPTPSSASDAPASPTSSSSAPSVSYEEWRELWSSFLRQAYEAGHYAADPGVTLSSLDSNPGAMKRAVLSLARQRGDILHSLDPAKLKALVKAGFPVDDRKTKNAHRRLVASIVDGKHLSPADGGPAELQDVFRVFLSLAACDRRDASLFKQLQAAAMALLPDIMAAAAVAPPPEAAALQGTQRYMPALQQQDETTRSQKGSQHREKARTQPRQKQGRDGASWLEAQPQESRWYDGSGRSNGGRGPRSNAGGRGGGRGGAGGRGGGGRGGRGPWQQQQQQSRQPRQSQP